MCGGDRSRRSGGRQGWERRLWGGFSSDVLRVWEGRAGLLAPGFGARATLLPGLTAGINWIFRIQLCASALSDGHGAVWVGRWISEPSPYTLPAFCSGG